MKTFARRFELVAAIAGLLSLESFTADWSQWRGTDRADHSPDKGLLKKWPDGG